MEFAKKVGKCGIGKLKGRVRDSGRREEYDGKMYVYVFDRDLVVHRGCIVLMFFLAGTTQQP